MELVIKIPERLWTKQLTADDYIEIVNAVANGTPLPEQHGDLIDRSKICKAIPAEEDNCTGMGMTYDEMDAYNDGIDSMWDKLQNANPVIKAGKEE